MAAIHAADLPGLAQAAASLIEPDVVGPLNELSEVLVVLSGVVSKLRRAAAAPAPDLDLLDDSSARAVALTRAVRERLQARRLRGEYTSLSHVVREVTAHLQHAMPADLRLEVHCPLGRALVAAERADLRRLLVALLDVVASRAPRPGVLRVELTEGRAQQEVVLQVRSGANVDHNDGRFEAEVKPLVFALGGTFQVRSQKDGASIVVRLRSEC